MLKEFVDGLGEWLFGAFGVALIALITVAAVCAAALMVQGTYRALTSDGACLVYK